ncbi:MAG: hypothetical protein LW817_06885 [Candidatus Caenarcaniphilales bacterium]|jgi:vacuolar-type H+-ATPase subunit I/STV1|nr:hypothetical protein [Candidatus Caenarcaniphilales bacterium]
MKKQLTLLTIFAFALVSASRISAEVNLSDRISSMMQEEIYKLQDQESSINPESKIITPEQIPVDSSDVSLLYELLNLEKITKQSAVLESDVSKLEAEINQLQKELDKALLEIETCPQTASVAELEKYATKKVIDVAEKEVVNGVTYDIDLYDHGKKLANETSNDEFLAHYMI